MIIQVLGMVGVLHGGELTRISPASKRIVAILVAAGPDGLTSDAFADELYGDDLPAEWEAAVRQSISRLRRSVPPGSITRTAGRYRIALPADEVDAWQLLEHASTPDHLDASSIQSLLDGEPFQDVEPSAGTRAGREQLHAARIQLIEALTDRADTSNPPPAPVLQTANSLVRSDPFREDLLVAVARLHASSGRTSAALQILDRGIQTIRNEVGAPVEHGTHQLLSDLQAQLDALSQNTPSPDGSPDAGRGSGGESGAEDVPPPAAQPRSIGVPLAAAVGHLDRHDLMSTASEALSRGVPVVIDGESGSGKSHLGVRLAHEAQARGHHVIWMTGQRDGVAAYGPWLTGLACLRDVLHPILDPKVDSAARSAAWFDAVKRLRESYPDRPISLFCDDAHWLDSQSQQLLCFIAAWRDDPMIELTTIGRNDIQGTRWEVVRDDLVRQGAAHLYVPDFTRAELLELVGLHHPETGQLLRENFVSTLMQRRITLPAIALEVIRSADPHLLTPGTATTALSDALWLQGLSAPTLEVAQTAAVIGVHFAMADVAAVMERAVGDIAIATDELLDSRLITALERPGEFAFRHVLIHGAVEATIPPGDLRRLHMAAADEATRQERVHDQARHLLAGADLAPLSQVVDALVGSARNFQNEGLYHEAVQRWQSAKTISDPEIRPLSAPEHLDFALALGASGADGWSERAAAVDACLAIDDHPAAFQMAMVGFDELEGTDGDERLPELFDRIDASRLDRTDRIHHAAILGRQLGLLGQHERALALSEEATGLAQTPDEKTRAWWTAWPTRVYRSPRTWGDLPAATTEIVDDDLRAWQHEVRVLKAIAIGTMAEVDHALDAFEADHAAMAIDVRHWHTILQRSLHRFCTGKLTRARELADEALTCATSAGITAAFSVRAAQEFMFHLAQGTHVGLLPLLEASASDVGGSLMAESGRAVCVAGTPGREVEGQRLIAEVAKLAVGSATPYGAPICAVLATGVDATTEPEVVTLLRDVLVPFDTTSLVIGAGVANVGPAARALAHLATDNDERTARLRQAIDEADHSGQLIWSVRYRRDLAELTGDNEVLDDARARAGGTEVALLIDPEA